MIMEREAMTNHSRQPSVRETKTCSGTASAQVTLTGIELMHTIRRPVADEGEFASGASVLFASGIKQSRVHNPDLGHLRNLRQNPIE